jgi:hypothetical protein
VIDIVEILIHWYAGRSQHELAASLGVDRKTLRKYLAPARAAGIDPGGPPMSEADVGGGLLQTSWPSIARHRDRRRRSTTAGWGCGSTRPRGDGGRCGRS